MNRKNKSIIWTTSKSQLEEVVKNSKSFADILRHYGLAVTGSQHKKVQARCIELQIDISHIPLGIGSNKGRAFEKSSKPLEMVMVEKSTYDRQTLKNRLIKIGLLEEKCAICQIGPTWNGQRLVLRLDHINGIRDDHRFENLRLLCPNCDSQTETFCGKNNKTNHYYCTKCNKKITKWSQLQMCKKCSSVDRRTERPSYEQLKTEVDCCGYSATGRKYQVSDNTIRKWIKTYTTP